MRFVRPTIHPARVSTKCPHPERYTAQEPQSTEDQLHALIHGLVIALQPDACLETGTYVGRTALAIAEALDVNGRGRLYTIERNPEHASTARARLAGLPATVIETHSLEWSPPPDTQFGFAWFDTSDKRKLVDEFLHYRPHLRPGAIVGFHDTGTHWPTQPDIEARLIAPGFVRAIHVPTPRGATLCEVL